MLTNQLNLLGIVERAARKRRLGRLIGSSLTLLVCIVFAVPVNAQNASARVDCDSISSPVLNRTVDYCVALPPGYDAGGQRYPVLYYLHGLFEHDRSWSEHSGQQTWESLMAEGKIGKFIVVMPEGGKSFYVNSFDGKERYQDFFISELVPAIDRKYRTTAERATRGITGVSMGGYGALHLAMQYPDIFGSASAHSAALIPKFPNPLPTEGRWGNYARVLQEPFGSPLNEDYFDANNPLTLAEHPERFAGLKLYFDCGDQDRYGFDEGAKDLDQILTSQGFPHEFVLRPGNHGWSYLDEYLHFSLEFHWQVFLQALAPTAPGKKGSQ
jgi:S-formylglutathione hydrolase FrmB